MKPKHKRLVVVAVSLLVMGLAAAILLRSFQDNLIFFYTPTQWKEKSAQGADATREMRIGGLVKEESVKKSGLALDFVITDRSNEVPATFTGIVPTLFREGQGVVAQGTFDNGVFHAKTILAKHDENYMPKEVVDELKRAGRWQQ